MKYYKIKIKSFYDDDMIATSANGEKIHNGNEYFRKMDKGEIISDAPIFDFFFLQSYDNRKQWEWLKADSYDFIGVGSQIPGWLISEKLKELLGKFKIAKPYHFYLSKLLYKQEKLDYYIFQFSGDKFLNYLINYINFKIINKEDLIFQTKKIFKESGFNVINVPIKKLVINKYFDFFSMQGFLGDKIVSEKLKQAIEENNITGFEFSELDYEVIVEK